MVVPCFVPFYMIIAFLGSWIGIHWYVNKDDHEVDQTVVHPINQPSYTYAPYTNRPSDTYVRGCYYAGWSRFRKGLGKYEITKHYEAGLCSHIFYAFAIMDSNLKIKSRRRTDERDYKNLYELKSKQKDLKILVSFGGWLFSKANEMKLKEMIRDTLNRKTFIDSIIEFMNTFNLDGFDMDWEYPEPSDKENFLTLMKEMRLAFDTVTERTRTRFLLTASVSGNLEKIQNNYLGEQLADVLDYMNVMTYKFNSHWKTKTVFHSPLRARGARGSISNAAKAWMERGMPRTKILIGMATYSHGFNATMTDLADDDTGVGRPATGGSPPQPFTNKTSYAAYFEICRLIKNQGFAVKYDQIQEVAAAIGPEQWYGYSNERSFSAICAFVKENHFAGAFVYTLDMDDFGGICTSETYPLIKTMNKHLMKTKK